MTIYSNKNPPAGFYVYAYLRVDGTPYYIGKGENSRAWRKHARSNGTNLTPRNHSNIIIMETGLNEIGAIALERFYIRWYGRKDIIYLDRPLGILRNMTDGGEGCSNIVQTPVTRHRKSISLLGKQKSIEHRAKMSANRLGKKHSEAHKANMKGQNTGPQRIIECPHCGKIGGISLMTRWHFNSCKGKNE